jgi:tRNA-specific adenosine deaminase 2
MEKEWMDEALVLATEALTAGEVPVGCIFVHNDEVIARSHNTVNETRNATRHAEMNCLDQAAEWCMEKGHNFATIMATVKVSFLKECFGYQYMISDICYVKIHLC